jgi:hypothetical protein
MNVVGHGFVFEPLLFEVFLQRTWVVPSFVEEELITTTRI